MVGQTFGRWTVLQDAGFGSSRHRLWLCVCACGKQGKIRSSHLQSGESRSCGCLAAELCAEIFRKRSPRHGTGRRRSDPWYALCAGIWYRATKKGVLIEFSTCSEFTKYCKSIAPEICPVFGTPLEKHLDAFRWSVSIDRIDPHQGYVRGNIQIISNLANRMKSDATPDELAMFAEWILSNRS